LAEPLYFADPFVLKTDLGYFAYGTDGPDRPTLHQTGREFPVLFSQDLVSWSKVGGALEVPPSDKDDHGFWAPEVAFANGVYTMFYSSGGVEGQGHQIQTAIAERASGPFVGMGAPIIPSEPFSIDAHPFCDPLDGRWYLFFAKDFFDEPVGTGIAAVPLSRDLSQIEDAPKAVFRAQSNWQVFQRDREWYGRLWPTWHCVEGPFVVYQNERYWMFYSGGNWHADEYGVGCAVAETVLGPYTDPRVKSGPSILRTANGLYGPGHNSVVVGPDGEDRICFHAWDSDYRARTLHTAKLKWISGGVEIDQKSILIASFRSLQR